MTIDAKVGSCDSIPPPFPVRRFTVQEYQRMAEAGILTDEDQVELLEGWVTPKMIHNPPHDLAVGLADEAIRSRLAEDWKIRIQSAITTEDSRPEPDVAVVRGPLRRYAKRQPEPDDIALIVEIADTSLDRDRGKCQLYARAGIPNYWIVNLNDRQIEVYTQPNQAAAHYAGRKLHKSGDNLPLDIAGQPSCSVVVDELLP